eukprot:594433-Prorocentrum_minimum.AAC.2
MVAPWVPYNTRGGIPPRTALKSTAQRPGYGTVHKTPPMVVRKTPPYHLSSSPYHPPPQRPGTGTVHKAPPITGVRPPPIIPPLWCSGRVLKVLHQPDSSVRYLLSSSPAVANTATAADSRVNRRGWGRVT